MMDTSEATRLHRCAKCGDERSAVESCEGDCYPLCGPCYVELRYEDAAVWRARVDAVERERDDLAATLETRNAEHAMVLEQLATVTAERDALAALRPHPPHRTGHRCARCGREGAPAADDVCPWCAPDVTLEGAVSDAVTTTREACARACDAVANGADNALVDATIPDGVAYLRGRRRGAEVCAEKIRGGGE